MNDSEIPYFLTNPEWYVQADILKDGFPEDGRGYHLTEKAPQEAIDSYNAFYSEHSLEIDDEVEIDISNYSLNV